MTKEELIGRKFITSSGNLYKIIKASHKDYIGLENLEESEEFPLGYTWDNWVTLDIANKEIDKEEWKLIEDEPKMYKTSKGIEYGVGTQFISSNQHHEIVKIDKDNATIKWLEQDSLHKYPFDTFRDYCLDNWTITILPTMKDYKQVDPKTIKFDFTNTKIKVNNEDESKWVQEVAFNNKYTWYSGSKTILEEWSKEPHLFFEKKYFGHGDDDSTLIAIVKEK